MTAIAAAKSPAQNRLEAFVLTALFQGLPTIATVALIYKLIGFRPIVGQPYGAVTFVAMATLFYGLLTPWLAACSERIREAAYEPLFYDATLSFTDKITQWLIRPKTSQQLLTTVIMMSLLAVVAASVT
ncbi:hypothetical protein JQ604_39855 [Bradyrhizobium jicamae]|uniref:hypothetical protein n=1 Tax=Bradyrhizobium jicamae TaxID=280332 RepID=UPI001BAD9AD5|nr:hypothetical protein [Bradyrhizobium jicamae]MBR0758370.1 hypothetical protein [Bradyrhizobium jicamae]